MRIENTTVYKYQFMSMYENVFVLYIYMNEYLICLIQNISEVTWNAEDTIVKDSKTQNNYKYI